MRTRRNEPYSLAAHRRFFFNRLGGAIGLALCAAPALAGTVPGGTTVVVNPGDPIETWDVDTAGTLRVAGGSTLDITTETGATVILDGATVTGANQALSLTNSTGDIRDSTITSTGFSGLAVNALVGGGLPGSVATVTGSQITSKGAAVAIFGNGSVSLSNTTATGELGSIVAPDPWGGGIGILLASGTASLSDLSEARGDRNGVVMTLSSSGVPNLANLSLTVENSLIEGLSESAIAVRFDGEPTVSDIFIRNNARLIGGNGNILEVEGGSTANFNVESSALTGNIVNDATSTTHVDLSNNASITGVFDNVTSATLAGGGRWQLAGDSDVGALTLNNGGTVALGDGTAFNTLTVSGDYAGAGGTLLFNTVLADDASA
ncbi:MAG: hypothetical protein ACN6RA_03530, partial [Stenotrophomonas maltophilia]